MQVHCLLLAVLAAVLSACNNDPKPKVEPKQEPQKLGENPIAAPLDYIAAIGKARKATLGRLDQAKLIDAIQKFEASEGRAPKDLSELVPNFITAIPPRSRRHEARIPAGGCVLHAGAHYPTAGGEEVIRVPYSVRPHAASLATEN